VKALSWRQPGAEQIVAGEKSVDIRSWRTDYRGTLAVHASAERRNGRCRELGYDPDRLTYGAIVGTVELVDIAAVDEAGYEALQAQHRLDGPFPGGRCFAWWLASPSRLSEPIPCRGGRGFFAVDLTVIPPPLDTPTAADGQNSRASEPAPGRMRQQSPSKADRGAKPAPAQAVPDQEHPFALYALPEREGGYRIVLQQLLPWQEAAKPSATSGSAKQPPLFSIEIGGAPLRAVADQLLATLRANGHKGTVLAAASGEAFPLDERTGLRLALLFLAVKPLTKMARVEGVSAGVRQMSDEEAYYWFSKCTGSSAVRAQKALRVLLADE